MHKVIKSPPREPYAPVESLRMRDYVMFGLCAPVLFYVGMMLLPSLGG